MNMKRDNVQHANIDDELMIIEIPRKFVIHVPKACDLFTDMQLQ